MNQDGAGGIGQGIDDAPTLAHVGPVDEVLVGVVRDYELGGGGLHGCF